MKTISATLKQGILDGTVATFIKITRKDGVIKGFTDHDVELTFNGVKYIPTPGMQKITMNLRNNAEISNQEFNSSWNVDLDEADLANGVYDDADIEVFLADWKGTETVLVFKGNLGLITWTDEGFIADVQSSMKKLQKNIGFTYTQKCRHVLFSQSDPTLMGACTLNKASYTFAGQVNSTKTPTKIEFDISVGQANDYFTNGTIKFITGLNAGLEFTVKKYTVATYATVTLFLPTPYEVNVGDQFEITAGCNKTFDECKNKFNNVINFGGFPHIKPEINWK